VKLMLARTLIFALFSVAQSAFAKFDVDLGVGYTVLDIKNPDSSKAHSTGFGGQLGIYYELFGNQNYSLGPKASVFYSDLENDANSGQITEETKFYNYGAGLELEVRNFFISWQYKVDKLKIKQSALLNTESTFTAYIPQFELGFEVPGDTVSARFVFQHQVGEIPTARTGLPSPSDVRSSAFFMYLRFHFGNQPSSRSDSDLYRPECEVYPAYRYRALPFTRVNIFN